MEDNNLISCSAEKDKLHLKGTRSFNLGVRFQVLYL